MPRIIIDADACPVKDETYRTAKRYGMLVIVVANTWLRMPDEPMVRLEVVSGDFDAADNWIADHVARGDIVISEDILLAARCIPKGALVLTGRGTVYDGNSIGAAVAQRELMRYLRDAGEIGGGHKPYAEQDRTRYRQQLDRLIQAVRQLK